MKKIIAILCFFVLLFGVALCEELPIPEEPIVNETELIPVEPSLEEETALELTEIVIPEEEVPIEEIAEDEPEPEPEKVILPREVHITFLKEPQFFGDEVTLAVTLINFTSTDNYTIYWQYCTDPSAAEWKNIDGAHDEVYNFILDKTNYTYGYRALVQVEE